MKKLPLMILLGCLLLAACSQTDRNNRQAALYAERLEQGEEISAGDYADIVEFYCRALDHALTDIEPAAKAHAAALDANDSTSIEQTGIELRNRTAKAQKNNKEITRLGSALQTRLADLPDSTRRTLLERLFAISLRYSDFH